MFPFIKLLRSHTATVLSCFFYSSAVSKKHSAHFIYTKNKRKNNIISYYRRCIGQSSYNTTKKEKKYIIKFKENGNCDRKMLILYSLVYQTVDLNFSNNFLSQAVAVL